jgi:DNA-binding CsgD family transcriptional regulator
VATTRRAALTVASALDQARAAWSAGEYENVLRLQGARFDRREDRLAAAVYQARALLALDRPEGVAAVLERASKEAKSAEETVVSRMLLGAAMTRTNKRERGESLLDEIAATAQRSAPQHVAEIAYYRALSRWSTHRLPEAEEIIESALGSATDVVRSRLLQLLGWIDVRRENYGAAAHEFTAALEELDRSKNTDVKGRARILIALGIIAAETIDLRLGRLVRREYEISAWSDDTRIERYQILGYLSWLSLLEGDVSRAWDERQLAMTLTVDTSYHADALTLAAHVAGIVGDRFSESRYLELAGVLLLRGDQVALDTDRRSTMLTFVAAPNVDPDAARKVLTLYDRTRPRRTDMLAMEGDRRIDALELMARGKASVTDGRTQQGVAELERALELWTLLTYRLRAALTANTLRMLTGDRRFAQAALDALRNAPKAWLRPALDRRTTDDDPLGQLTPAERRVLAELCKGKKAREIADGFDRSFNTINNHTRAIFSAFGVRSRAALVAECARLGILDDIKTVR